VRSILYRFPDLQHFDDMVRGMGEAELELGVPSGEAVEDGEWVLAIFELGAARRATSAAARATVAPEGSCLTFEPRDWKRLADFAHTEARRPSLAGLSPRTSAVPAPAAPRPDERPSFPDTAKSAVIPTEGTPADGMPASDSRAVAKSGAAHVLVVDDDPDIRDVVSAMLEAVDLFVTQAASAEEALHRVRREPFDLMVLDWNLPKMTGVELCRLIRHEPGLSALPVLFLTANASSQDMVDAFASGADDYVVKPFRAPELGARIFALLRRVRRVPS
jgi:two-component system phosphate regulon response regulator PhoB